MNKYLHNALVIIGILLVIAFGAFLVANFTQVIVLILIVTGLVVFSISFAITLAKNFGWWRE